MDDEPAQPTDMLERMRAYHETGFDGPMRPEHVPALAAERASAWKSERGGALWAYSWCLCASATLP